MLGIVTGFAAGSDQFGLKWDQQKPVPFFAFRNIGNPANSRAALINNIRSQSLPAMIFRKHHQNITKAS